MPELLQKYISWAVYFAVHYWGSGLICWQTIDLLIDNWSVERQLICLLTKRKDHSTFKLCNCITKLEKLSFHFYFYSWLFCSKIWVNTHSCGHRSASLSILKRMSGSWIREVAHTSHSHEPLDPTQLLIWIDLFKWWMDWLVYWLIGGLIDWWIDWVEWSFIHSFIHSFWFIFWSSQSCDEPLSLEHNLLFCSDLIDIREKYVNVNSLKVFSISCKFLVRNIHLFLMLNCLIVWMSEWVLIWHFNLMWCR